MLETSKVRHYKIVRQQGLWRKIADCWSLIVGLMITGRNFALPLITVRYPWKTIEGRALSTYRGHVELVPKEDDPTQPKCIMCGMCVKVCPSYCLDLTLDKIIPEITGKNKPVKILERFIYTYHLCSLCGLCVQTCPVGSLRFSGNIYYSGTNRSTFVIDLIARLLAKAQKRGAPSNN